MFFLRFDLWRVLVVAGAAAALISETMGEVAIVVNAIRRPGRRQVDGAPR
jgi:hypothetical protein